jgi:hypothetical protein
MDRDLLLKGKYTFKAHGQKLVVVKKPVESTRHVVMKALLWAIYLPRYPDLQVEVPIGYKYKPDLVQTGSGGPLFWAEAGRVSAQKLRRLLKRFPRTHFALAVWGASLAALEIRIRRTSREAKRLAPIDLIAFPRDADVRFIDSRGTIRVDRDNFNWRPIPPPRPPHARGQRLAG